MSVMPTAENTSSQINSVIIRRQTTATTQAMKSNHLASGQPLSGKMPDEVLSLFVNMIKELLGLLKYDTPRNVPEVRSGFSLSFPALPIYRDSETSGTPMFEDLAPLPRMVLKVTRPVSDQPDSGTSLKLPPLPSFVSPATGSLSTTDLPRAFNPPPIPSLTGGSSVLPSINANSANIAPAISKSSSSSTASQPSSRVLRVAPLPSFVSPATGSLSTTDLPRAFNPPPMPSLAGDSHALPQVNAVDSRTVTGATSPAAGENRPVTLLSHSPLPSLTAGNLSTLKAPRASNPPTIPSLTGGSAALSSSSRNEQASGVPALIPGGGSRVFIPSLASNGLSLSSGLTSTSVPRLAGNATLAALSSPDSFSVSGASQLVENLDAGGNGQAPGGSRGNHFK